jgi:hypothetical protein
MTHRIEHDALTDEITLIPLTDSELKEFEAAAKANDKAIKEAELQEAKKAKDKADLFAKLGITADEASLLLS